MRIQRQSILVVLLLGLTGCRGDPAAVGNPDDYRPTTLIEAVLLGDQPAVEQFLARGANVNVTEVDGTTPLMRAIHGRFPEIAKLLIEAGADVSAANQYGVTPLYLAARDADAASTRLLLRAGADARSALPEGETVLMTAAKAGSADIVRVLLTGGMESLSLSTLAAASDRPSAEAVTVTSGDPSGYGATVSPTPPTSRADVNAREGWYGQTALMWAAAEGHADVVKLLIEAGANVDEHSQRIDAPEPNPERISGAFVDPPMPTGYLTALHFAAREGHVEAVRALIEGRADVNAADEDGTTALGYATANNHSEVARLLIDAGAT